MSDQLKVIRFILGLFLINFIQIKAEDSRPNIIMILADDMGYSDLGAFGGEVKTPHIDQLAGEGLRFTQTYNSARCCPSRASLLTGLYSHLAGIADFVGVDQSEKKGPAYRKSLNKECVTLAEVLKSNGYNTYGVGKWHVGDKEDPINRGFDEYYGYLKKHSDDQWIEDRYTRYPKNRTPEISFKNKEFYATEAFNDYAVEFIKQGQQKDKPYFLYLAHSAPHFPLHAPAKTRDTYLETYRKGWDVLRKERYERQKQSGLVAESWKFTELSDVPLDRKDIANGFPGMKNPAWKSLDHDIKEDLVYRMATFAAMVEHVDRGVGKILNQLKENNDLENTLIIFTSDNGACYEWGPFGFDERSRRGITTLHKGKDLNRIGGPGTHHSVGSGWSSLSNTPLRMYKHFNHEGGSCSPMVMHWPKGINHQNRWVRDPVHLIDIMPTLCEISHTPYPLEYNGSKITPVSGVSLNSLMKNEGKLESRTLCFDHFESSAIRKDGWKLVRGNKRYNNRQWELYNIDEDRCETKDLIETYPEKAKDLEKEWLQWAMDVKLAPYYKHKAQK